jgi:hypothetical protein
MRLACVEQGYRLPEHLVAQGYSQPSDVVKTLLYRPEFFGDTMSALFQAALRGPSVWSVGQRELFAAFVSQLNRCRF